MHSVLRYRGGQPSRRCQLYNNGKMLMPKIYGFGIYGGQKGEFVALDKFQKSLLDKPIKPPVIAFLNKLS